MDTTTGGDVDALLALDPIECEGTDDAPTGTPPEQWDPDVHADALAADPDVDIVEL